MEFKVTDEVTHAHGETKRVGFVERIDNQMPQEGYGRFYPITVRWMTFSNTDLIAGTSSKTFCYRNSELKLLKRKN
jgi:hypothetical protein